MLSGLKICTTCAFGGTQGSKVQFFLRFGDELQRICIPAEANVGDLRRAVGKKKKATSHLITMQLSGKLLRDDSASLEAAGLFNGSTVQCDLLPLCGGVGFKCIPVENFNPLLHAIEADYEVWKGSKWSGLSNDVQAFFKAENIDPTVKYSQFYADRRHTIATSYVWSATGLFKMAGYCTDA
jgi:hypothetical protein